MGVVGLVQAWLVLGPGQGQVRLDVAWAGLLKPLNEWWRLLTAPLLHGSMLHLVMNGMAMLALAQLMERLAPRWWVGAVWLAGALAGGLASALWNVYPSVGASGGIVAMMAFVWMLGWRWQDPALRTAMQQALLLTLGLGLLLSDLIDNAAHAGGLLAGLTLGWAYAAWVAAKVKLRAPFRQEVLASRLVDALLALQVAGTCFALLRSAF